MFKELIVIILKHQYIVAIQKNIAEQRALYVSVLLPILEHRNSLQTPGMKVRMPACSRRGQARRLFRKAQSFLSSIALAVTLPAKNVCIKMIKKATKDLRGFEQNLKYGLALEVGSYACLHEKDIIPFDIDSILLKQLGSCLPAEPNNVWIPKDWIYVTLQPCHRQWICT